MEIVQDHEEEFDQTVAKKIQDMNLFRNVKDMADQLRPVAVAIDRCQSDEASLATACDAWLDVLGGPNLTRPRFAGSCQETFQSSCFT